MNKEELRELNIRQLARQDRMLRVHDTMEAIQMGVFATYMVAMIIIGVTYWL